MLTLTGLLAASCGSASSSDTSHYGTITGYIMFGGGPGAMSRPKVGGTVTVFDGHGKPVAHTTVRKGQQFHFRLPPGRYQLNSGTKVFDTRDGCHAGSVVLHPSASLHVNVFGGCSIM